MKNLIIAALASGHGSIIPTILESCEINLVISNKANAPVLENAKKLGIKSYYAENEGEILTILKENNVDLILLIGYMRILSEKFVTIWKNKIMNVHPSLLPKFAGLMNLAVHKAVLEAGENTSGCTVHFVTATVDGGPIILQKQCEVKKDDTPESLRARVQAIEGEAMVEAIKKFASNHHPPTRSGDPKNNKSPSLDYPDKPGNDEWGESK